MRDILFRGINKNGKAFVGSYIYQMNEFRTTPFVAIFPNNTNQSLCVEDTYLDCECGTIDGYVEIVEKESVGQWSGLKDKNGTMIFEGDKVRGLFLCGDSVVGVCDFQRAAFGLKWMRGDIEEFTPFCCTHGVEWEVVDNE